MSSRTCSDRWRISGPGLLRAADRVTRPLAVALALFVTSRYFLFTTRYAFRWPFLLAWLCTLALLRFGFRDRTRFWGWTLLIVGICVFTNLRGLADDTEIAPARLAVAEIDRALGMGEIPTARLQRLLFDPQERRWWDRTAHGVYATYFTLPYAVGLWLSFRRRAQFSRFVADYLATHYLGLIGYFLYPCDPPWLASGKQGLPRMVRILWAHGHGPSAPDPTRLLSLDPNPQAAMPSLHLALVLITALALWRLDRRLGIAGIVWAAAMSLSLVYLGEHYVIDLIAAVPTAAAGALLGKRAAGRASARAIPPGYGDSLPPV